MTRISDWLITLDSEQHIIQASFSLYKAAPEGYVHTTHFREENKSTYVYWYGCKPNEVTELGIYDVIQNWLAAGRLG